MKTCFKCGETCPRSDFYQHPRMGDGLLGKCKPCTRQDVREHYIKKVADPAGREVERHRGRDKYHRLYRGKPTNRPRTGPNWVSPPSTKRQRLHAHNALLRAVKAGTLTRPEICADCGLGHEKIHGHHTDYSKPLDVVWVCPPCHRRRHAIHPERVRTREQKAA